MQFQEVIGQKGLAQKMRQNITEGRIAHAQMLVGADGTEVMPMTLAYIAYLLCEQRGDDACGQCSSCLKMQKLSHPDVHWIFPASLSDASGKPSKEQQIAEQQKAWRQTLLAAPRVTYPIWLQHLQEERKKLEINKMAAEYLFGKMALKSYEGGMKVGVIWKPERMNASAANTLLKIIEEPPKQSLFLLVSENPDAVLTTITSRTQVTRIPKTPQAELAAWLVNQASVNEATANTLAFAADGNAAKAVQMAAEMTGENEVFVIFRAWMRLCFSRDLEALRQWVADNAKLSRDALSGLLQYGLQIVSSALQVQLLKKDPALVNPAEVAFIKKFAPFVDAGNATAYYKLFNEAIADIQWNGNAKIILSDLSFKFMMLLHQKKG